MKIRFENEQNNVYVIGSTETYVLVLHWFILTFVKKKNHKI